MCNYENEDYKDISLYSIVTLAKFYGVSADYLLGLADIEIYVDGIAGMQVESLNTWVDVVRKEIMANYRPSENDTYIRLLKAAHIVKIHDLTHSLRFRNIGFSIT